MEPYLGENPASSSDELSTASSQRQDRHHNSPLPPLLPRPFSSATSSCKIETLRQAAPVVMWQDTLNYYLVPILAKNLHWINYLVSTLEDPDPKYLISDPDPVPAPNPPLFLYPKRWKFLLKMFYTKLRTISIMKFLTCLCSKINKKYESFS